MTTPHDLIIAGRPKTDGMPSSKLKLGGVPG